MRFRGRNYEWIIMGANSWISGKPSIEKIIVENGSHYSNTIVVATRHDSRYGAKPISIFILGSGGQYGEINSRKEFLQDTGNGYGKDGYCMIENIIQINNGKIVDEGNGIGLNEKRPLWVFK